jgi:AcrR family transcriptional regulator
VSAAPTRLPAAQRRQALIETAQRVFSEGTYRGTTTAEIARAAGVSEPILYRHFASKRDLYLAALDHVWGETRSAWERTLAESSDVRAALETVGRGQYAVRDCKHQLSELWIQALSEAADDLELRKHLRRHMREVHDFFAGLIRRGQAEGVFHADRDADTEAWSFMAGGLFGMVGRRVGLLDDEDVTKIKRSRMEWLSAEGPAKPKA